MPSLPLPSSIHQLREEYRAGRLQPHEVVEEALAHANSNAAANVYLAQDKEWVWNEVEQLKADDFDRQPLWGVPVSLKDCFDLKGFVTTCGSKVLGEQRSASVNDSAVAAKLREAGAIIIGKTHMHQLAYGITGENLDFGDCVQPGAEHLLTGGSSSGAAASILEGSALAAIGSDTGGSIRVPASLSGVMGYRGSITLGEKLWAGGEHLAATFDTLGWLYRDAQDGPLLGNALFDLPLAASPKVDGLRVGVPDAGFLQGCDSDVLGILQRWVDELKKLGASVGTFEAGFWNESLDIYTPIQANEASVLRPEPRGIFEPVIAQRLRWGAALDAPEIASHRGKLDVFRRRSEAILADFDVLLLPTTPVSELRAGEDQTGARMRILRYTTPVSLLGWPAVTLPGRGAPNLVGKLGADAALLALSAAIVDAVEEAH